MKSESYQQFAIVKNDQASLLEGELNKRIRELRGKNPEVRFGGPNGLTAYISYIETNRIPESIADEYEQIGAGFRCGSCPRFRPVMKADGTEDGRVTWGNCDKAKNELGRTYRENPACNRLYEEIREGRIGLCFRD